MGWQGTDEARGGSVRPQRAFETGSVPAASLRPAPGDDFAAWLGRTVAGRVRLMEWVGGDEHGELFRGERLHDDMEVAVRIDWPKSHQSAREFQRAFREEARVAMRLDHPHIGQVYHYGQAGEAGVMFMESEWLDGFDLEAHVVMRGAMTGKQSLSLASQLAHALRVAHEAGIVHGDLRPSSVLLTGGVRRFVLKLRDFGRPRLTAFSEDLPIGWASYMAPEQIRGDEPDARSDVYSVGALLYHALTGEPPFGEATGIAVWIAQSSGEGPVSPRQRAVPRRVPKAVNAMVMRCLESDPEARFQSMAELLEAVEALRNA